jgi:hypothetical protein
VILEESHRPNNRLGRRLVLWLAIVLASSASCSTLNESVQPLVPTRHQVRTGPFILFSNLPLPNEAPAVRCLQALERDLAGQLDFRPRSGDDPVEIYVLDDRNSFIHFLKFHFPELPSRRAFFLARGSQRVVYTYASPRLEEDLRHEATHALLRGTYGDLPLWIDEGLAEYFESDLKQPGVERDRIDAINADFAGKWQPDLERLESLSDIREMTPRDYREAWAWVHLLLNGSEPGKTVLLNALAAINEKPGKLGLTEKGATNALLLAHLKTVHSRSTHVEPQALDHAVRFQNKDAQPAPVSPALQRSFWRRMRGLIGI